MVIYDLVCELEHRFEGWFKSEQDFIRQHNEGLLCCPACDSRSVRKIPSASYVVTGSHRSSRVQMEDDKAMDVQRLKTMLNEYIVANTEDVGDRFVEEVRKMHYGEIDERGIRGSASGEDVKSLNEEGINVITLSGNFMDKKKLN